MRLPLIGLALFVWLTVAWSCGDEPPPALTGQYTIGANGLPPTPEKLAEMGRLIFFDPGLSASGRQSCASCHSPAHAYGPPNALPVQPGGPAMNQFGFRNTPSLRYIHSPFAFTEHYVDLLDNNGQDSGPAGGRTWDGRVNLGREQALMPLLDSKEMANRNLSEVVQRLRQAPYAQAFDEAFSPPGTHILDDEAGVISWLTTALEFFEQSPDDFHPFSSKYDAYLRGQAKLTPAERRGFDLFRDKEKGNCAQCHPQAVTSSTLIYPRFTDFEYFALGAPRNTRLPANRDPAFFDMGLCGPLRHDLADKPDDCGRFRTPTLRNTGWRQSFFHNGVLHSLREVIEFYVTRDITPQRWYGRDAKGRPSHYNDLPAPYQRNVFTGVPFKPLPGNKPRLNAQEIQDLLAFLHTLDDGYKATATSTQSKRTMATTSARHPLLPR